MDVDPVEGTRPRDPVVKDWKALLRRLAVVAGCIVVLLFWLYLIEEEAPPKSAPLGPYATTTVTIRTTNPSSGGEVAIELHYPARDGRVDPSGAPYPALVFVPGTFAPPITHSGNAAHLASWGYVVALPRFTDNDLQIRLSEVQHVLSYLEAENSTPGSALYQVVDTSRLGLAGHSLGGITPLMIAARDDRPALAVVPLDPVNPGGNAWDYEAEGPHVSAPVGLIGAPAHVCNWFARYNRMVPHLGSTHKATFVIAGGAHCDFLGPGVPYLSTVCGLACGQFSEERLTLIEHYTAAWFNYYVRLDTDFYGRLYGDEAAAHIEAGLIARTVETPPRDVAASSRPGAVHLTWALYDHPIIAGYSIYRASSRGGYASAPYAQVGRETSYLDTDVAPGQRYFYVVRSRDAAGNEHQASVEVSAVPGDSRASTTGREPG